MTDIENYLLTRIKHYLETECPAAHVVSASDRRPTNFPCVAVEITSRRTDTSFVTSTDEPDPIVIAVSITVFTADKSGARQAAKELLTKAQKPLLVKRFLQRSYSYPRRDDTGVYRVSSTLEAGYDGETFYSI